MHSLSTNIEYWIRYWSFDGRTEETGGSFVRSVPLMNQNNPFAHAQDLIRQRTGIEFSVLSHKVVQRFSTGTCTLRRSLYRVIWCWIITFCYNSLKRDFKRFLYGDTERETSHMIQSRVPAVKHRGVGQVTFIPTTTAVFARETLCTTMYTSSSQ